MKLMRLMGVCLFLLLGAARLLADSSTTQPSVESAIQAAPAVYPYYVDPAAYPDYARRPVTVPSWSDFDNRPQLVSGRDRHMHYYPPPNAGNVSRPMLGWANKPINQFRSDVDKLAETGRYLHNIGGLGPNPYASGYGEWYIPQDRHDYIMQRLGHHFTGWDLGEQDGRYAWWYKRYQQVFIPDKVKQYQVTQPYIDRFGDIAHQVGSELYVTWYWHQPIKEGYTILAAAEMQNKITSGQLQYAYIRGACKQYGILWFGDQAMTDSWWYKSWNGGVNDRGPSIGLVKRFYNLEYMWDSAVMSIEYGWRDEAHSPAGPITEFGLLHQDINHIAETYGRPGFMHTPVAVLNEFYSGWQPARTLNATFRVWNGMDYSTGDYLTDAVWSMIYPKYEQSGFFFNEQGAISDTPYGDIADGLLTDCTLETLRQYPLVVAAGDFCYATTELRAKLEAYARQGGTFIVTAANAKRLWPEWEIDASRNIAPANSIVHWSAPTHDTFETNDFTICSAGALPAGATALATCNDRPVVVAIPIGAGSVLLDLAPFGLNENPLPYHYTRPWGAFNETLTRPYALTAHTRELLDVNFKRQMLFDVGNPQLGTVTCRRGPGEYFIGVYNNSQESRPFHITSRIGTISSISEIETSVASAPVKKSTKWGPYPNGAPNNGLGRIPPIPFHDGPDDATHIYGGDIRIFQVKVGNESVRVLPEAKPVNRRQNRLLAINSGPSLIDTIRTMPTFFDNFEGVKLDWMDFRRQDVDQLVRDNTWMMRQKLKIIIDFTSGFRSGQLTLDSTQPNYSSSQAEMQDIFTKMARVYDAKLAIVPLQQGDRAATKVALAQLAAAASPDGIQLVLKHADMPASPSFSEIADLVAQLNLPALRVAVCTSDAADGSQNLQAMLQKAGKNLGLVLVTSSAGDISYAPRQSVDFCPQVLDADYTNWNDIYHDANIVWRGGHGSLAGKSYVGAPAEMFHTTLPANAGRLLGLHDIADLPAALAAMPDFWNHFGGVKVDAPYVISRDRRQCAEDKKWLDQRKLRVVVDLSYYLDTFIHYTLMDSVHEDYARSTAIFASMLDKMHELGSTDLIICNEQRPDLHEPHPVAKWKAGVIWLCRRAAERGIAVYLQNTKNISDCDPATIAARVREIDQTNLKMCANGNFTGDLSAAINHASDSLGLIVVGAQVNAEENLIEPFFVSKQSPAALSGRNVGIVLDGGYKDWNQIHQECSYIGW